jgi:type IV pilus assembly protein PilF
MMKANGLRTLGVLGLMVMVCACTGMKKPKGEMSKFEQCRNPKYVPALKDQAKEYYRKDKAIEALKILKEAEACHPRDPEIYYLIGHIYYSRDRQYEAIEYFQKALAIDKKHTESRLALAVVYLALHRWDEAIAQFNKAAEDELYKEPWLIYNNLSWAYLQKGNLEMAELNAKKSIELNEQWCPAYCNLGEVYSKKGMKPQAVINYQKAIKVCKESYARPHFLLALELGEMGHIEMACQELGVTAGIKNAPEAEQAADYQNLYNCPDVIRRPAGR